MIAAWVDGVRSETVSLADRALHYGDAAFTTMRVHAQRACWFDLHIQRLLEASVRMLLPVPDVGTLRAEIERAALCANAGVIKVLLSRGDGERGYAPQGARGRRMLMVYPAPAFGIAVYGDGANLRFADLVLSEQSRLAGLKHANRLEQVLARAECADTSIHEALMSDARGNVVSATAANLFARFGNELRTPALGRSGVAGVCRQQILQSPPPGFSVTVADMQRSQILAADELFLSNCVRGIVPVHRLADHQYDSMAVARMLMRAMHPTLGLPVPE